MSKEIYKNVKQNLEMYEHNYQENEENKLSLYSVISDTTLSEDIKFDTVKEQALVNQLCNMESSMALRSIGNNAKKDVKEMLGVKTLEDEKALFIKLFMRDYLYNMTGEQDLALKDNLTAGVLFRDFASKELRENEEFCRTILTLDGRNMPYMEPMFRNNMYIMKEAIENDTSKDIESFTLSDTVLKTNPQLATLYFQKRKELNGYLFKPSTIYSEIFEQEDGEFPTKIFKNGEQKEWLKDCLFLVNLVKLDNNFVRYIVTGKIPMNLVENEEKGITAIDNPKVKRK